MGFFGDSKNLKNYRFLANANTSQVFSVNKKDSIKLYILF